VDAVRRDYLARLGKLTNRNLVLYAMKPPFGSIESGDVEGFHVGTSGYSSGDLDLVITRQAKR